MHLIEPTGLYRMNLCGFCLGANAILFPLKHEKPSGMNPDSFLYWWMLTDLIKIKKKASQINLTGFTGCWCILNWNNTSYKNKISSWTGDSTTYLIMYYSISADPAAVFNIAFICNGTISSRYYFLESLVGVRWITTWGYTWVRCLPLLLLWASALLPATLLALLITSCGWLRCG